MPNQTVDVSISFAPTGATFTFSPDPVAMTGSGTITFRPAAGQSGWTFNGFGCCSSVQPVGWRDFAWAVADTSITVNDSHADLGQFYYKVAVKKDNRIYWSPDPEIDNNP